MKKSYRLALVVAVVCAWAGVLSGCSLGGEKKPEGPKVSTTMVDINRYLDIDDNKGVIVVDGVKAEKKASLIDGGWYIPYEIVSEIEPRFYINGEEEQMIFTDAEKSTYYYQGLTSYREGDVDKDNGYKAFVSDGEGNFLVNCELLRKAVSVTVYEKPCRIIVNTESSEVSGYEVVSDDVALRTGGTEQNDIVTKLSKGKFVAYAGDSNDTFMRVMTEDGYYGYVKFTDVTESKRNVVVENNLPEYKHQSLGSEFQTMVWHNMIYEADGSLITSEIKGSEGIDVIIPTWYRVAALDGTVSSNANHDYVNTAHSLGLKVFGLIDDFAPDVKGYDVYSNTAARKKIVSDLVNSAVEYGLDGINIDFEYITPQSAPHYLQLLRELYLETRKNNLYLTICDYVPDSGNTFYDLKTQNQLADYIMIMTYDENYNASSIGSVASKTFVSEGIANSLASVPKEKLLMGVPFYTRAWAEGAPDAEGNATYEMIVLTMKGILNEVSAYGANVEWLDEYGQNYATYVNGDGKHIKVWLEDAKSIQVKRDIANQLGIAGVSCWALGQQDNAVWDILK